MYACCQLRPEDGIWSPETGITDGGEPLFRRLQSNLCPLQEQQMFITSPFTQSKVIDFE